MSFTVLPDQYPGRCVNVRSTIHPNGHVETLRCLDYEGTAHVCTFPKPAYSFIDTTNWSMASSSPAPPKPWVKPV